MSLLAVDNLSLQINDTDILHDVSFAVQPREIVALTGESGSGKSITALSVMGLLPQGTVVSGQVQFDGQSLLDLPEPAFCRLRGNDIAMVFQEPMTALNPVQTIGAQVAEAIRIHQRITRRAAWTHAAKTLDRVGLPNAQFPLNTYPHQLSGGQRQRVVIAIAIAMRPKLLIADEPTTALDVTTQATVLALLKDLVADFDMGLLIITHDLAVVRQFADQIVVMQKGQVVEAGPTEVVFDQMRHPYTRSLFAASQHQVDLPAPPKPAPLLSVKDVTRIYKRPAQTLFGKATAFTAVQDVSFELHKGERVGLVGESGCGKSTLTRAILGLDATQSGEITLGGLPVFSGNAPQHSVQRKMQVVFQDPYGSFNPRHKVARLIAEPLYLSDNPPQGAVRAELIAQTLQDVGLTPEDAEKYIHEFSGGQRQRIAIARALISEPELIIFDEAVSALDVSVRAQILDLLADLCRKRPLAYLFISHDLSVVRSVTDRVLVMQAGKIMEQGQTETVFQDPKHPYTKALLDAAPRLDSPV
jgi:peptide/nickel transport system ATP-binding protein